MPLRRDSSRYCVALFFTVGPLGHAIFLKTWRWNFLHRRGYLRRRLRLANEDIVHHIEHAHTDFLRCWREPWCGLQRGAGIRKPLLPAVVHGDPAEFIVLARALWLVRAISELYDIHLGDAAELTKPLGLFGIAQLRRKDFHQLLNGVPHFVLLSEIFGGNARATGEANVFFAFAHFLEICRQLAAALKNIDLERQAAAPRIVIQHVLQRRGGDETAVPVVFAVHLKRLTTRWQGTARHHLPR